MTGTVLDVSEVVLDVVEILAGSSQAVEIVVEEDWVVLEVPVVGDGAEGQLKTGYFGA